MRAFYKCTRAFLRQCACRYADCAGVAGSLILRLSRSFKCSFARWTCDLKSVPKNMAKQDVLWYLQKYSFDTSIIYPKKKQLSKPVFMLSFWHVPTWVRFRHAYNTLQLRSGFGMYCNVKQLSARTKPSRMYVRAHTWHLRYLPDPNRYRSVLYT